MTDASTPTPPGAQASGTRPHASVGTVGGKRFTARPEPPPGDVAPRAARKKRGVFSGVKRLLRAAIQGPRPRAASPLQHATRELDEAYERLLRAALANDAPDAPRVVFAMTEAAEAAAAYVDAGGRLDEAGGHRDEAPAPGYAPMLGTFTFTELLLLRERLPRLLHGGADGNRFDAGAAGIFERCLAAVEVEMEARERPFAVVLRRLAQPQPEPEDLDGPLCVLARAVRDREKRGESALRFLRDLAASRSNEDLEYASAALATARLRMAYGIAPRVRSHASVTISAHDGGARACARLLKDALDGCIRSRLVLRARLACRQNADTAGAASRIVQTVLGALARGVAAMHGDGAGPRGQAHSVVMELFTEALAGDEAVDLRRYLQGMSDPVLQAFERHLPFLPSARRRLVLNAIEQEHRRRELREAGRPPVDDAQHVATRTMARVGMQATPILARLIARIQSDLRQQAIRPPGHAAEGARPAPSADALTRMSFDITARTNGDYDVSVTADLAPRSGDDAVSLVYKSRVSPDLRPLRGTFRRDEAPRQPDRGDEPSLACLRQVANAQ